MDSPFAPRLGTNYSPDDEEVLKIKTFLIEPRLRLKCLANEIAELQKTIDKLSAERDGLGAFVEAHQALISPVRRLPLDIIQEIFVACIPTHRNCVMSASEAPVLLGRICSSWRAISLSTPRLWARLHIVEPPSVFRPASELHEKKAAQRLEVTKMWLDRSGQCPLSISLRSAPEYDSPPASPSISARRKGQILQTLIAFAPRWQHVRFTAQSCLEDMAHLTVSDVPILESIAFHLLQRFPPTPVTFQPCEMLRSPRISSFSISGNNFIPEKLPLHWHQLTNLTIDGPVWETLLYSETALHTLSRCPNLRGCKLVINDGSPAQIPVVHPAVELQFLRTLELDFGNVLFTVARLLERLSVPELRTFTFHGHVDPQSPFSLAPFFGSWTRLECLNISSNTFVKPTLLDMLQNLPPTLRRLTILDITRTSEFMSLDDDSLAVLATSCPTLETLIIKYCFLISDASLLQFITARMTSESRPTLRRVEIQFNRHMTLDIFPSLEPFIKTGLNVSITHLPVPIFPSQFSPWQGLDEAVSAWVYP